MPARLTQKRAALLLALSVAFSPAPAFGWWDYGHRTIARLAMAEVRPATRIRIARLLRRAPALGTPGCPMRTIEDASVWPDCVKKLPRFRHTIGWHFQDVPLCAPFALPAACREGNCVSAQIMRQAARLEDRTLPARERRIALAFLVHLVGDLHQPLHASDRADQGGGKQPARYGAGGPPTNLHIIWDGYLAERAISTPPAGAIRLARGIDKARLSAGTVEDWSRESWMAAREAVYRPVLGDPCAPMTAERVVLDEVKIQAAIPILRLQVARAGFRLARLLDEALS